MTGSQIARHLGKWLAVPVFAIAAGTWILSGLFDDEAYLSEPPYQPISAAALDESAVGVDTAQADAASTARTSEAELDRAIADAFRETRASEAVKTRAVLSRYGVLMAISAEMPPGSRTFGRYLNLRFTVVPRDQAFKVTRLAIGRYEIPSGWIGRAFGLAMERLPGADRALAILSDIRDIDPATRTVSMGSIPNRIPPPPAG